MPKEAKHNFKSFDADIKIANKAVNDDPKNESLQDRRRGFLALRRGVFGDEKVTDDQLVEIAKVLSEAERTKAAMYEKLEMENRAVGSLQLADDIDVIVLEVVTTESTDDGSK